MNSFENLVKGLAAVANKMVVNSLLEALQELRQLQGSPLNNEEKVKEAMGHLINSIEVVMDSVEDDDWTIEDDISLKEELNTLRAHLGVSK